MDTSKILMILCAFILVVCLTMCITTLVVLRNAIAENESIQTGSMILMEELDDCLSRLEEKNDEENSIPTVGDGGEEAYFFLLRATENGIGIYSADGYLIQLLDISPLTLPAADRLILEKGLKVSSWQEMISLIEDYHG